MFFENKDQCQLGRDDEHQFENKSFLCVFVFKKRHPKEGPKSTAKKRQDEQDTFGETRFSVFCQPFVPPEREEGDDGDEDEVVFGGHSVVKSAR